MVLLQAVLLRRRETQVGAECWPLLALSREKFTYDNPLDQTDEHFQSCGTGSIECHDDDNNGLWTSLVVAAEAFRYGATRENEAEERSRHFLGGLQKLWDVTGVPGLMARSLVAPGEGHGAVSCPCMQPSLTNYQRMAGIDVFRPAVGWHMVE